MKKLLLLFLFPCLLFSEVIILFPIESGKKDSFSIPVPPNFQEIWKAPNGKMVEFIPQDETLDAWTEILTVETLPRQPQMLDFYLRRHKIAIETLFTSAELARSEISLSEENGIHVGYAHYRTPHYQVESQSVDDTFMECMGMKLVQGKNSLYRIAYNIKYPKGAPHLPIEEKIQTFLDRCSIIESKPSS